MSIESAFGARGRGREGFLTSHRWWIAGAAVLAGGAFLALRQASGTPWAATPASLDYAAICAAAEPGSVDGFVKNRSAEDQYQVDGQVRFRFYRAGSISRPELVVFGSGIIEHGQTARVARARLPFPLTAAEECRFDVSAAIRVRRAGWR